MIRRRKGERKNRYMLACRPRVSKRAGQRNRLLRAYETAKHIHCSARTGRTCLGRRRARRLEHAHRHLPATEANTLAEICKGSDDVIDVGILLYTRVSIDKAVPDNDAGPFFQLVRCLHRTI